MYEDFYTDIRPFLPDIEEIESTLYVAPSNIEGGGRGVFSSINVPKGEIIAEYKGQIYPPNAQLSDEQIRYSFTFPDYSIIVPYDNTIARYINDTIDLRKTIQKGDLIYNKNKYNVDWLQIEDEDSSNPISNFRLFIVTTKNIKKGDELFIDYGIDYWIDWVRNTHKMMVKNNMLLNGEDIYNRIIHLQRLYSQAL